jgi:hypothetical protein
MGTQSYSFIVPFLHSEARVSNLVGQYVQPAGERMTPRLRALLGREPIHVAFLDRRLATPYVPELAAGTRADVNAVLSSYGLKLTMRPCEPLVMSMPVDVNLNVLRREPMKPSSGVERPDFERMHVCPVEPLDAASYAEVLAGRRAIDAALDRVEAACGRQLNPHGMETLRGRDGWLRTYFNSQKTLMTNGEIVFVRPFRSVNDAQLGRLSQWQGDSTPACPPLPNSISLL